MRSNKQRLDFCIFIRNVEPSLSFWSFTGFIICYFRWFLCFLGSCCLVTQRKNRPSAGQQWMTVRPMSRRKTKRKDKDEHEKENRRRVMSCGKVKKKSKDCYENMSSVPTSGFLVPGTTAGMMDLMINLWNQPVILQVDGSSPSMKTKLERKTRNTGEGLWEISCHTFGLIAHFIGDFFYRPKEGRETAREVPASRRKMKEK